MSTRSGDAGGSKGTGLGIGIMVALVFTLMPLMVAVAFYVFAQVQAIITGMDLSSESLNVPVFLIVLVGTVALFVVGVFALIGLVGRSFSPKRRKDVEAWFEEAEVPEP